VKRPVALVLWALATIVLSAGTSLMVHWRSRSHIHEEADFHEWMHRNLDLSAHQHDVLEPAEQRFEKRRAALRSEISEAGRAIGFAIQSGEADSPEITAALEQLQKAQAELQRATVQHFFEMKEQLDPEQSEKLRQWTHDRLLHP
jgi:Spy/CpxP family protein refolding chaperone